MCWRADSARAFAEGRAELSAQADRDAGGLIVIDRGRSWNGARHAPSPSAVLEVVRDRVERARREGLAPWVLAPMECLTSPRTPAAEVVAVELELAELAADTATGVVCAYRAPLWRRAILGDIAAVHSRVVGTSEGMSGFRLRPTGARTYALEGSVGFESLRPFAAALRGALLRSLELRLRCESLDMIDAAAWRALVETVAATPGASVVLEDANEVVRGAWRLSGYAATGIAVQVDAP